MDSQNIPHSVDDQWIIIQNCQFLSNDQLSQLETLIEQVNFAHNLFSSFALTTRFSFNNVQIAESEFRKESFRMFIIIYPSSGEAKHSLLGKTNVVTVSDNFTLKNFLLYCYEPISPMFLLHEQLESVSIYYRCNVGY